MYRSITSSHVRKTASQLCQNKHVINVQSFEYVISKLFHG